jgi:hypothetical protein
MTVHWTGRRTLEWAVNKAVVAKDARADKKQRGVKYRHVRLDRQAAYDAAVAENERLGIHPRPMTRAEAELRFAAGSSKAQTKANRAKVTLSGVARAEERPERELIEEATAKAVATMIERCQGYLDHILDTPEPNKYISSVNVRGMIDALTALGLSIKPRVDFALSPRKKRHRPREEEPED